MKRRRASKHSWPVIRADDWCGAFAATGTGVPAGDYRASIIEARVEPIDSTGRNGRRLCLTWLIVGGVQEGERVMQRLDMWAENLPDLNRIISKANAQFAEIRRAVGKTIVNNTDELLGIQCAIVLRKRFGQPSEAPREVVRVAAVRP